MSDPQTPPTAADAAGAAALPADQPPLRPADGPAHRPAPGEPPVRATTCELFARFIFLHAHGQSVRVMEAVAAVVANQVGRDRAVAGEAAEHGDGAARRDRAFRQRLLAAGVSDVARASCEADAGFAACLRIARRALAGALVDPTAGATLFHPIGGQPAWSRRLAPSSLIGGFLFYREEPAVPPTDDRAGA